MRNVTIYELVDWVVKHRTGKAFYDYPYNKIASCIVHAINHDVFVYTTDTNEQITGIVCGEKNYKTKTVMIHDILCIKHGAVKKMMQFYLSKYPDWRIVGECRNRVRIFNNPQKLERRLQ